MKAVAAGHSTQQAVARYQIGIAKAIVWVRRARSTGEKAVCRQGPARCSKLHFPPFLEPRKTTERALAAVI
ncbi:transposase [Azospirillum canadense]|nr:transposase [Azospirillum canadense]